MDLISGIPSVSVFGSLPLTLFTSELLSIVQKNVMDLVNDWTLIEVIEAREVHEAVTESYREVFVNI